MDMFGWLNKKKEDTPEAHPLRVEGIEEAPITVEPDDAERAAKVLLEEMSEVRGSRLKKTKGAYSDNIAGSDEDKGSETPIDYNYYQALAERIRQAQQTAEMRVMRFLSVCEHELRNKHLPFYGEGSLAMLEAELYKRIDIVDRAGGELKFRWQHCLAEVTVRLMDAPTPTEEKGTAQRNK